MAQQKKKDSFVLQAGILVAAGIIVKIIGLLYRSPLISIIGLEGNGYYNNAINMYTIILLVSSYSIPSAISKVIAQRLAYKEYRNAQRVFQCALIYVLVVGGIASLLTFFCAPFLTKIENAVPVLRVFAPTIFFSGLLGVLRGYFQAHGTMVHTSLSQILEQIFNAAVSMIAAYLLKDMVSGEGETIQAIYGASGSALGTGAGVLIALLFMFGMYRLNKDVIKKRVKRDRTPIQESYGDIFKVIITTVTPFILSTFIYNCSTAVNMYIHQHIMIDIRGVDEALVAIQYGIFGTQAITIINIPIAIASSMSSASIPSISATFATHKEDETRHKVRQATQMTMILAIPCAVGLCVLSKPIVQFIYPQKEALDMASALIRVLGITVILYGLSTLTNAVLQGIGKVNVPVIHAAVALAAQVGLLIALLLYTDLDLYALAIANIVYSLIMCILNHSAVKRYLGYREDVMKTFVKPGIAAACMGAVAFGIYQGLFYFVPISRIVLLVAIAIAASVYFILIIKLGVVNEAELKAFPKGHIFVAVAKKLHLLK
ncbi:MAG: polysaccharide biosynthesis protein [Bacillus sp. (in: Bacteria)]|nr:polysaccharide biosynthesis protein [Bacillus sp. (in: firmicutes)]MCM1425132.1 polysaccharide biosynthesis protein [Eubacterium sp.]